MIVTTDVPKVPPILVSANTIAVIELVKPSTTLLNNRISLNKNFKIILGTAANDSNDL